MKPPPRMHGRHETGRPCAHPGCAEAGEYRAPLRRPGSAFLPPQGPPEHQWLCLEHVRRFNAGWNYFDGMTPEEVYAAQSPYPTWEREARAGAAHLRGGGPDRFEDAAAALRWRHAADAAHRFASMTPEGRKLSDAERGALRVLGLDASATLAEIKARFHQLARKFHPDSNAGDRSNEGALREAVEAYDLLRGSKAFA